MYIVHICIRTGRAQERGRGHAKEITHMYYASSVSRRAEEGRSSRVRGRSASAERRPRQLSNEDEEQNGGDKSEMRGRRRHSSGSVLPQRSVSVHREDRASWSCATIGPGGLMFNRDNSAPGPNSYHIPSDFDKLAAKPSRPGAFMGKSSPAGVESRSEWLAYTMEGGQRFFRRHVTPDEPGPGQYDIPREFDSVKPKAGVSITSSEDRSVWLQACLGQANTIQLRDQATKRGPGEGAVIYGTFERKSFHANAGKSSWLTDHREPKPKVAYRPQSPRVSVIERQNAIMQQHKRNRASRAASPGARPAASPGHPNRIELQKRARLERLKSIVEDIHHFQRLQEELPAAGNAEENNALQEALQLIREKLVGGANLWPDVLAMSSVEIDHLFTPVLSAGDSASNMEITQLEQRLFSHGHRRPGTLESRAAEGVSSTSAVGRLRQVEQNTPRRKIAAGKAAKDTNSRAAVFEGTSTGPGTSVSIARQRGSSSSEKGPLQGSTIKKNVTSGKKSHSAASTPTTSSSSSRHPPPPPQQRNQEEAEENQQKQKQNQQRQQKSQAKLPPTGATLEETPSEKEPLSNVISESNSAPPSSDSGQELNKRQLLNLLQMRRLEDLVSKASLADQERLMVELSSCKKMALGALAIDPENLFLEKEVVEEKLRALGWTG